jgi:hypothetical protein
VRPRSLAVFAAVVLALGAFIWFYERELPSTAEREAHGKRVFGALEAEEVREVLLAQGGQQVRLVREAPAVAAGEEEGEDEDALTPAPAAEWRLAAPLSARADRFAVDGLLSTLLAIEKARTLEGIDRGKYGLQPPAATVTLVDEKGRRTLEVGREIPGTDQRVVALAGEADGWAVGGAFWSEITKPPADWRSRELFPGTRDEVERVALQTGGRSLLLARRGEDWWVESPLADRADRERVEELLGALTGLQAEEFLDTAPPAAGLEPPQALVEVVRRGRSEPFRVALGASRGEGEEAVRYARAGGQLVAVRAPALGGALQRPPAQWRSLAWTAFAVYEVDRIEITDAQGKLALVRDEADWKRSVPGTAGEAVKVFYAPVSDLLAALADARAERVLSAEEAGAQGLAAGAAALTVRLVGREGEREQTLTLVPGAAGAPAVGRASDRQAVLLLPAALPADLAARIAAIRQAEPLEDEPAAAMADGTPAP